MRFGLNVPTAYWLVGVAIALSPACGASLVGTANPPVTKCGGHCDCGASGCCELAQVDCAGVRCLDTTNPYTCEYTGDGLGPADLGRRRDAGRPDATVDAASGEWGF